MLAFTLIKAIEDLEERLGNDMVTKTIQFPDNFIIVKMAIEEFAVRSLRACPIQQVSFEMVLRRTETISCNNFIFFI